MKNNISIFIMTYNEELDIKKCIESVLWSDDIVILDSYSSDNTIDIVTSYPNTSVHQRKFDNYAAQRNFGMHELDFKNEWVLVLDADETCSVELKESIFRNVIGTFSTDVFCVRRKTFFKNKWVKHNTSYDVWIERVLKPKKVSFYGIVHEKIKFDGNMEKLFGDINHYQFSKGIKHWTKRRVKYAILESFNNKSAFLWRDLFSKNPIDKRVAQKSLYNVLPFKYLFYFLYNILIKMCFLDGITGVHYILLETRSQYLSSKYYKKRKDHHHDKINQTYSSIGLPK